MATPNVTGPIVVMSKPKTEPAFVQVLEEYQLMLSYALSEGRTIDDTAQQIIQKVPSDPQASDFAALLKAHAALAKIVAPATPLSLIATEPLPGPLGYLRRPPLIIWMIAMAAVGILGFVITEFLVKWKGMGHGVERWNWFFAAMVGAVFYVLFTAHEYVKNRTYDPRYGSVYVIRFALGILSGLILAVVLSNYILGLSSTLASLGPTGPAVLALLGGFSTEAVYQILQRLVDVLTATVRGDGSDAAKAKASQAAQTEFLALADDPAVQPDLRSKIIAAAKKVAA